MVFRYIDVKQLSIDAKVAGILCVQVGGPIKYKLKPDIQLPDDWLFEMWFLTSGVAFQTTLDSAEFLLLLFYLQP